MDPIKDVVDAQAIISLVTALWYVMVCFDGTTLDFIHSCIVDLVQDCEGAHLQENLHES